MPHPGPVSAGVENLIPTRFWSLELLATASGYKYNYIYFIVSDIQLHGSAYSKAKTHTRIAV